MLYTELSPESQERACENYRRSTRDDEWWKCDYEHWKEKLAKLGFCDAEIQFRGFGSQGDGASFTAGFNRDIKLHPDLEKRIAEAEPMARVLIRFNGEHRDPDVSWECHVKIYRDIGSHYVHANTIQAEVSPMFGTDISGQLETDLVAWFSEFEKSLTTEARDLSNKIYRSLESTWDDIDSDANIERNIVEMQINYNEDGEPQYLKAA